MTGRRVASGGDRRAPQHAPGDCLQKSSNSAPPVPPELLGAVCACVCAGCEDCGAAPPEDESGWACCCGAGVWDCAGAWAVVSVVVVDVVDVDVVEVVDAPSSVGVVPVGTVRTGVVRGTSTETLEPPQAPAAMPRTATTPTVSRRRAVPVAVRSWDSRS